MRYWIVAVLVISSLPSWAATLGRSVAFSGGASDVVLDERRNRVYLPSPSQSQVLIYNLTRQAFDTPIPTDTTPIAAAMSRDGRRLYVTCYDGSALNVIDLDSGLVVDRIGLPGRPEGVAVASDEIVVITTTGSGGGGVTNSLLLYNPAANAAPVLSAIPVVPPQPGAVVFPPPSGRPFLSSRSRLSASRSGNFIVGVNQTAQANPNVVPPSTVFVYESASRTVLRSRTLAGVSTASAISDDGTRVFAGTMLFEGATLQVLAQQAASNIPYPIDQRTAFTTQALQGGAVFSTDGQTLYAGLNVAPIVIPAPFSTTSQLMLGDPDNLMVRMGIQIPDNLAGKMVLSADGSNMYALSDGGFAIIPVGTIPRSPLATPATTSVLLVRDPCGVNVGATATLAINNPGTGRITPSGQLLQIAGLANQPAPATAPAVRTNGTNLIFTLSAAAARGNGTFSPAHEFIVSAPEAINIPERVRVLQNARDSDARGTLVPIPIGLAASPLPDLIMDTPRQRLYIANASYNRVEIYDIRQQRLLAPIKVGQTPISMALTPDGTTLYVANAGGESINVVDPERLVTIGRVSFPPLAFNSNLAVILPSVISWSQAGLMVQTTNGMLWKVVGDGAVPRPASRLIGSNAQGGALPLPASTMASTPAGEYVLITAVNGTGYLYDAVVDDFIAQRQIFNATVTTGFFGPVAAGPQGRYFVSNGNLLNPALQAASSRPVTGLVSAVAQIGATSYAIYSPPPAAAANTLPAAVPTIQLFDANTGNPLRTANALEGPLTSIAANARATTVGRSMALDAAATTAFAITASGLSVIPLTPVAAADRPAPAQRGTVNLGSYQTAIAPNALVSIFGQNLGTQEIAPSTPLPIRLGGTCVTLNNIALPLFMVSPGQINAQIPPELAAGNYPLVVRSLTKQAASVAQTVTVSRYAPAVLTNSALQPLVFHADGVQISKANPAQRDEPLTMYAVGLGATTGGRATAGLPTPASPLAETADVKVFFGNPLFRQSEVIVDFSGLTPGYVGLYQLNLRVPGFHEKGDELPITIRIGGVDSPTSGPVAPVIAVE